MKGSKDSPLVQYWLTEVRAVRESLPVDVQDKLAVLEDRMTQGWMSQWDEKFLELLYEDYC